MSKKWSYRIRAVKGTLAYRMLPANVQEQFIEEAGKVVSGQDASEWWRDVLAYLEDMAKEERRRARTR